MSEPPESRKPLVSFSVGPLSVSLWENDVKGKDRKFRTVTIRKTFTNGEGQPDARTVSVNTAEVGCLAGLLTRMQDAVVQHQETEPV